jgi:NAD-dependent deacetylase
MSADAGADMGQVNDPIEEAARTLVDAAPFPVLTGAGISAESGIPTFRGPGGVWSRYDPYEYGHIETFRVHPERTWQLLMEMIKGSLGAAPNGAHMVLAEMEGRGLVSGVITQNVDGLHTLAGSRNVVELHGNARMVRCLKCGNPETLDPDMLETFQIHCFCGGMKKPDIVLYGENLPLHAIHRAQEMCQRARAVLVIGTSGIVYPAAALPEIVRSMGGRIVEINPSDTALTEGGRTLTIPMGAVMGVSALFERMKEVIGRNPSGK